MTPFGFCTVQHTDAGAGRLAVSRDGRVVELTAVLGPGAPGSMDELLADFDRWTDRVAAALADTLADTGPGGTAELDEREVRFLPPVPRPSAIYCAGANYFDHLAEMGAGEVRKADLSPFHFMTAPSAMTGHRGAVHRPPGCLKLDWEVELTAVIGRPADHVTEADALGVVAGYTIANDVSARDYLDRRNPALGIDWLRHKSFNTLLPIGPCLVPARFVPDPQDLTIELSVNGQTKQHSNTAGMVFGLAEQIAALSQVTTLLPGDLVLTGTPSGTAVAHGHYLRPGDLMVARITGLGSLENAVAAES
jgi:2-keto-4-pentenoate hydratase/2-oxohepta-3-ene-1,7-dioic acid hydratase in catechol pathway